MIILTEGIDKSGKSTVIQDLKEKLLTSAHIWKVSNKPKTGSKFEREKIWIAYDELFHQALANHKENHIIFDRAYPSELVYSVKRRYDAFYDLRWWKLDEMLKGNAMIIYCYVPETVLEKRFYEHGEKDLQAKEFSKILQRYEWFLTKTKLPVLKLDTTKGRMENLIVVKDYLDEYQRRSN